jgi:RHS repeat-associated protein
MTNDGSHAYTFDAENHLIQVDGTPGTCSTSTACYIYDANGRRSVKLPGSGVWTQYFYDLSNNVISEFGKGCGPTCWATGYVYFNGSLLAEYENSTTNFLHKDHLGSTHLISALNQSIVDNIDYLPFGEQLTGASATSHKFTGKERDAESGLDNFGARYNASQMGRFMSPDPVNLTWKRLINPGNTLNKYAYAANNPLLYVDPNGKDVTVFYRQSSGAAGDAGHVLLAVTNQQTGQVRFADYYPKGAKGFTPAPGEMNQGETSDRLKQHAALTIRTTPEIAQKLIDRIDALSPPNQAPEFMIPFSDCVVVCADLLNIAGIDVPSALATPEDVWSMLYGNYSAEAQSGGDGWPANAVLFFFPSDLSQYTETPQHVHSSGLP